MLKRFMECCIPPVVLAGGLFVYHILRPRTFCMLNLTTGLHCPSCGGTRMVNSILAGDFIQAFRYNPYIFISLPILFILYILGATFYIRKNNIPNIADKVLIGYVVGILVFGVLRNFEAFSCLAPTIIS